MCIVACNDQEDRSIVQKDSAWDLASTAEALRKSTFTPGFCACISAGFSTGHEDLLPVTKKSEKQVGMSQALS